MLLLYVSDVVSHFLKCLDHIALFPRKTFAIGQMPQQHDDGISDLAELLSIGADRSRISASVSGELDSPRYTLVEIWLPLANQVTGLIHWTTSPESGSLKSAIRNLRKQNEGSNAQA